MADAAPTPDTELYPWHAGPWQSLVMQSARLPHALLLHGQSGLGKAAFAGRLTQTLLCDRPGEPIEACGHCKSCLLFAAGSHPDLVVITPEEEGKAITVDQIRALSQFLYLRPHLAARKVTLITPADAMNVNAANSLLKLLEEPPLGSVMVLTSSQPHRLPLTIRSRCRQLGFPVPPQPQALAWLTSQGQNPEQAAQYLALAGGAPLLARQLAGENFLAEKTGLLKDLEDLLGRRADPVTCAARWKSRGTGRSLGWLQGFLGDLIKTRLLVQAPAALSNPDAREKLHAMAKQLNLNELYGFLDTVSQTKNLLPGPLDESLLLEDILIRWTKFAR